MYFLYFAVSPDKANEDAVLIVQNINFHIDDNVTEHYTGDYDIVQMENPCLVIRRGFPFKLGVTFNRSYDKEKDVVCLVFTAKGKFEHKIMQSIQRWF